MNNVNLIGRLGRDPELRVTATGTDVVNFTIAVDRISKDKEKATDWIPVTAWGATAGICHKFLVKGSKVAVSGRLQSRQYQDKQGNSRTAIEVVASAVDFLDPKGSRPEAAPDITPAPAVSGPSNDWEAQALADIDSGLVDPSDLPF